jgi:hypothetical protein
LETDCAIGQGRKEGESFTILIRRTATVYGSR